MDGTLLSELLRVGGISALAVGVLFFLYRQLLGLGIFPKLSRNQAFLLLCIVVVLVFAVVYLAFENFGTSAATSEQTNIINTGGQQHINYCR